MPWIHDAPISSGTPQSRFVYTLPPMRSRASMRRTGHPASVRLRAADRPAMPAPTTSTALVSGGGAGSDAQAAASPPPSRLVVAAKNSRRDIGYTAASVSHVIGRSSPNSHRVMGRFHQFVIELALHSRAYGVRQCGRVRRGSGDECSTIDSHKLAGSLTNCHRAAPSACARPTAPLCTQRCSGRPRVTRSCSTHGITCAIRAWATRSPTWPPITG